MALVLKRMRQRSAPCSLALVLEWHRYVRSRRDLNPHGGGDTPRGAEWVPIARNPVAVRLSTKDYAYDRVALVSGSISAISCLMAQMSLMARDSQRE